LKNFEEERCGAVLIHTAVACWAHLLRIIFLLSFDCHVTSAYDWTLESCSKGFKDLLCMYQMQSAL